MIPGTSPGLYRRMGAELVRAYVTEALSLDEELGPLDAIAEAERLVILLQDTPLFGIDPVTLARLAARYRMGKKEGNDDLDTTFFFPNLFALIEKFAAL